MTKLRGISLREIVVALPPIHPTLCAMPEDLANQPALPSKTGGEAEMKRRTRLTATWMTRSIAGAARQRLESQAT
jgi:hypothetical protein